MPPTVDRLEKQLPPPKVRSNLHAASNLGWRKLQNKKVTVCQAAYLFVINVTLQTVSLITLLTSNQPTDIDRESLNASKESLAMQRALLLKSAQAAKAGNETSASSRESLDAEKQSLEMQRESLEREKSAFELQKQTLELAKWTAYHKIFFPKSIYKSQGSMLTANLLQEYVVGCAKYAKEQVTSDRCKEALEAFDKPPPHLPSDPTAAFSKRRIHEALEYHEATAMQTQDGPTSLRTFMAATTLAASSPSLTAATTLAASSPSFMAATTLAASLPSPIPSNQTLSMASDFSGPLIRVAVFLAALLLTLLFFGRVAVVRQKALWVCRRIGFFPHEHKVSEFAWQEKGDDDSNSTERLPIPAHHSSTTSGSLVSLPVGLRNRRDTTRQLTAKRDIWTAAFHGDTTAVQELLIDSDDVNKTHPRFGSPLQAASQGGHIKVANLFLRLHADPNVLGGRFYSPLQAAAYSGELELVKLLLAHGADKNAVGGSCGSPLLAAVERGSIEMVRLLVDAGADVHQPGGIYGNTLQIASFRGSEDIVSLLLKYNVAVDARGGCYDTALIAATTEGHLQIVKILLQHSADTNWASEAYGNALQIACRQDCPEIARVLLEHGGCDTSVQDQQRRTPLHEAARSGRVQLVQSLLQRGADANLPDIDGWTPLHHAALNGYDEIVELLLASGADVHARDKFRAQPLFRACDLGMGYERTVTILLDADAEINACDAYGRAAIHCQSADENVRVQQILIERGAFVNAVDDKGQTPLHRATDTGNLPNVKLLLEAGAKINLQDNDQATALHIAVVQGSDEIALLLLQQVHIDINVRSASAFQEAIAHRKWPIVEVMLAKRAALNAQGSRYGGVIQAAVSSHDFNLFKMLIERKANVNIQGGEYGSALNAAAFHGHIDMVELLLEYGANPYIRGGRFGCVLSSARKSGLPSRQKEEMVRFLKSYGAQEPSNERMPHEYDRWVLTPGGWVWLPQDSL
ncbi:MAG: hypothetical protein Q9221_006832 [Calogaya cf. arnoldii]